MHLVNHIKSVSNLCKIAKALLKLTTRLPIGKNIKMFPCRSNSGLEGTSHSILFSFNILLTTLLEAVFLIIKVLLTANLVKGFCCGILKHPALFNNKLLCMRMEVFQEAAYKAQILRPDWCMCDYNVPRFANLKSNSKRPDCCYLKRSCWAYFFL